jgi:hypothetical protein
MPHVALIGDSIFDNGAYTRGGLDVVSQVRELLPPDWEATLLAVDGATTKDVHSQLVRMPASATHLVLSIGGNDALMKMGILQGPIRSMTAAVEALADIRSEFDTSYRSVIGGCLDSGRPTAVCTIYNGCFEDPAFQRIAAIMLTIFNDAIIRVAVEHALPVIDLRSVCCRAEDYANPIEPSSVGGARIARAITGLVTGSTGAALSRIVVE